MSFLVSIRCPAFSRLAIVIVAIQTLYLSDQMKTWISLIAMVLALFILIVYLFLPATTSIVNLSGIGANQHAVVRALNQQEKWDTFSRGHCRISEHLLNGANVNIAYNENVFASHIIVIPITPDSVNVRWECNLPPPHNPFSRITNFLNARELKSNMSATIDREFKKLCEDSVAMYGMNISIRSTADTNLIATRFISRTYPDMATVYQHIGDLKKYAASHKLKMVSTPMFNATITDSNAFKCMVALQVDKVSDATGDIFKLRIVPGKFLSAELRGGVATVRSGENAMLTYIQDYRKTIMALPFQQFITDRQLEKDTTKWLTRIYYPTP